MTRPRKSPDREIFGILGKLKNASKIQKEWNKYFKEKGIDAFMARYPAKIDQLPERLSEMFHFDRRMYLVGEELQELVGQLLDELHDSVDEGKVTIIKNEGGIFTGFFQNIDTPAPYRTGARSE